MLRHNLNNLPPGAHEEPVEIELMGELSLPEFINALKEGYKEAGPRFGVIPTPQWKLADLRARRAGMAGKAGEEGPKSLPNRLILRRPVTIKSSNPKKNATVDMGTASLVVCGSGITIEGVDLLGYGRPGLTWEESHGILEVERGGDLTMKSCGLSIKPPAPRGGLPLPLGPSEDEDADEKKPAPPPPPARDCSVVLVHDGGRATFDDCKFSGSPLSYGVVTRGQGTRVLMENCKVFANKCSNVLACNGAMLSLLGGCALTNSIDGYGLAATDKHTQVFCSEVIFDGNSRDNVMCLGGAKLVAEDCTIRNSLTRSGIRAHGEGSIAIARGALIEENKEHAVRASWGAWASVKGCRFGGRCEDGMETLVEGPESTLVQDRGRQRSTWRFMSTMERPWSSMNPSVKMVTGTDA